MSLSTAQKALLRSEEQRSVLGLAILQPKTMLACVITDYTGTDMVTEFTFGSVTAGSYSNVLPGHVVYVGSSAGAYDLGIARARKAWTSSMAYIGEESEIAFANGVHITVVDAFDVRAKHLVVTEEEVFMDVDVDYSDQHENYDPIIRMGGQVVVDAGESYPVTVDYDLSDTDVFDDTIASYSTSASEGSVSNGTTTTPTVTISSYPTNGYIRVATTVTTTTGGKSFTSYRYIFVFDDTHRPIEDFVLEDCGADRDSGGWSATVTLNEPADITSVRVGGLAVIFSKDYYGGASGTVGLYAGRENIWISGWVYEYSSINDPEFGPYTFDIKDAAFWMSRMNSFPTGVEITTSSPTVWTQVQNLTLDKGLFHYLHWRTTVTQVMDVYLTDDTKYTTAAESSASNIWGQIVDIAESQILAKPTCNYNGMLAVKVPYNLMPAASRNANSTLVMALTNQDYTKTTEIRKVSNSVSQVVLSGIVADEYGNGTDLYSLSPGHTPGKLGDFLPMPNMLLASQSQSNTLAGLIYAKENNPYPEIPLTLHGNNRAFDIAPIQYATVTGLDEYTGTIIPVSISYTYDHESGKNEVEIVFEGETDESDAIYIDGDIPDGTGGFVSIPSLGRLPSLDPLDLPDIPSFPTTPPSSDTPCSSNWNNYYSLVWSKPYLDGSDADKLVSNASFSCKLRGSPNPPSYIVISVHAHGDAYNLPDENVSVYAMLNGSKVATGTIQPYVSHTDQLYVTFNVASETLVDGFQIELEFGGWVGDGEISIYSEFACTATQVNDFTIKVQEAGAGNYSVGITAAGPVTLHYWLPPGFIGRIARSNTTVAGNLNWIATQGGSNYQGLTDGLWSNAGARDAFNDWFQYPTPSIWLDVASVAWSGSNDTKLNNGVGAAPGTIIEINYNTEFYIIAGILAGRALDIYGATLYNVCSPS